MKTKILFQGMAIIFLQFSVTQLLYAQAGFEELNGFSKKPKPRPNILFIVIDDASCSLAPPNMPSYVVLPGFDSVRMAGVTISSAFCTYSLCNPSRTSFLTSLFAHQHGALDNNTSVDPKFKFFTQALNEAGYHIQVCGKFTNTFYEYAPWADQKNWMAQKKIKYRDPKMYFGNGTKAVITGHTTSIIGDTANAWLAAIDTPFFLWEGIIVPHTPTKPLPSSKDMFSKKYIPLKTWIPFTEDYPSFAYTDTDLFYTITDSDAAQKQWEKNYECFVDIDATITKQLNTLKSSGLLDNTMVIIINDNGYSNGEHLLKGKQKPYTEAIRLPCYIRYKPWFTPGSHIDSVMFTSLDVGPTILDVAGVDDLVYKEQQMGMSIRKRLIQGRKDSIFYYEDIHRAHALEDNGEQAPSFRGVRTFSFNYVSYHCDTLTEQLFDLKNDPDETKNEIRNPSYKSIAAHYRFLLDSLAIATHDTVSSDTFYLPCKLISSPPPVRLRAPAQASALKISLFPNPADEYISAKIFSADMSKNTMTLTITNSLGAIVSSRKIKAGTMSETIFDLNDFPDGVYLIRAILNEMAQVKSFVVDHGDGD